MSTIWRVSDPVGGEFLEAGFLWDSYVEGPSCEVCGRADVKSVQPLVMEWEAGPASRLGDFTWPDLDRPVVTGEVAAQLDGIVSGFEFGPVTIVNEPRVTGRRRPYVIDGLDPATTFHELFVTTTVGLDRQRSTGSADPEQSCEVCGIERWQVLGVETVEYDWHSETEEVPVTRYERVPGHGVFVDASLLDGPSFFFVKELGGWLFCNDEVGVMAEEFGWTNLEILEYGETFDGSDGD